MPVHEHLDTDIDNDEILDTSTNKVESLDEFKAEAAEYARKRKDAPSR